MSNEIGGAGVHEVWNGNEQMVRASYSSIPAVFQKATMALWNSALSVSQQARESKAYGPEYAALGSNAEGLQIGPGPGKKTGEVEYHSG